MPTHEQALKILVPQSVGTGDGDAVSAIYLEPESPRALLVFGHGASTDVRHRSMVDSCQALADHGVATLRYNFPYKERGGGFPDPKPVLIATVMIACETALRLRPDLPLFAGGRSFGGRMSSTAQAHAPIGHLRGLVFYGFPLHPSGRPSTERADHLKDIAVPMLFLHGVKDSLAVPELMTSVVAGLGPLAELKSYDGADHSFKMPKSKLPPNLTAEQLLAMDVKAWMNRVLA